MLEIVSKNNNLYNVLDTEDGVVESCSFLDIISVIQSEPDTQELRNAINSITTNQCTVYNIKEDEDKLRINFLQL